MASLSTCHLGLWLGWQILLNLEVCLNRGGEWKGEQGKKKDSRGRREGEREEQGAVTVEVGGKLK